MSESDGLVTASGNASFHSRRLPPQAEVVARRSHRRRDEQQQEAAVHRASYLADAGRGLRGGCLKKPAARGSDHYSRRCQAWHRRQRAAVSVNRRYPRRLKDLLIDNSYDVGTEVPGCAWRRPWALLFDPVGVGS
jgi:hypothetical protein